MYTKFQKYWAQPNMVLLIAVVLDPSKKLDLIKFYFYTIGENVEEDERAETIHEEVLLRI